MNIEQVKEKILIVIDGERYPRLWHFKDQIAGPGSWGVSQPGMHQYDWPRGPRK